jgi:hypothetical protein
LRFRFIDLLSLTLSRPRKDKLNYWSEFRGPGLLLTLLESIPEVAAQLAEPNTQNQKLEDVATSAKQAVALALAY